MKNKVLLVLGVLLLSQISTAQTYYKPGYVITNSADTLSGNIDYRGDILMGSICKFKTDSGIVKLYSPKDIVSYRFINSKYYVSREINDKAFFLEYLIKGKVNIYYLRDDAGDHYYIDKEGLRLSEIIYKEGIKSVNNSDCFYHTTLHIGVLKYYMQDAPELFPIIENLKQINKYTLTKLAEIYNTKKREGNPIAYKKRQPLVQIDLEATGGIIKFEDPGEINDKYNFCGGVLAHIWMPNVNEKLFFRTGILYSSFDFRIPLQIEYIYPKNIIRPKVAIGINMYRSLEHSIAFMGGVNIKISESIFGSVNCDIDFTPIDAVTIFASRKLSHSFSAGILVKL